MRRPVPHLSFMVANAKEVAKGGASFDQILDCTSEGVAHTHPFGEYVTHTPPTGSNDHNWTSEDLDAIVKKVSQWLEEDQWVLIHCGRGVSRSTCAAAAVLLHLGEAKTVEQAVEMCRDPYRVPVKTALSSLRSWWNEKRQMELPL